MVVLYTASVQGYVEPCGCTAEPLGGIARFSAAVEDARAAYGERVVVLDAGDLLFEKLDDARPADLCQAEARVDLLLDAVRHNGLVATVLGPLDDVLGAAFRDGRLAARDIVTLSLGGTRALEAGARQERSVLHDAGGVKVGVVGFRADDAAAVDVQRAALVAEVAQLVARGAQTVVALAQAPRELTRRIVTDVPGLDVVILGRAPGEVPVAPERIGGVTLVAAGQQAQHVGVLELVLDGRRAGEALALDDRAAEAARRAKVLDVRVTELRAQVTAAPAGERRDFFVARLAAAEGERAALTVDAQAPPRGPHIVARAIPLSRLVRAEPRAAARLAAYDAAIPALVARCEATVTCADVAPGTARYVGAATCKGCHAGAWSFWQAQHVIVPGRNAQGSVVDRRLSHATAWDTLVRDGKQSDRSCVVCHSSGFELPGGPCKTSEIVERGLSGVQCESCHGPGSMHASTTDKAHIVRAPAESTCRGCHQVPHIETTASFIFDEKLKLILGPGHGAPAASAPQN